MINKLRAAIAAIAVVSTAPASAALFTYDFTSGGEGVYAYEYNYEYQCDSSNCTYTNAGQAATFTMNGSFTVDTSKLPADGFSGPGLAYDSYPNTDPAAQFLSGSITKVGGSLPIGSGVGGGRSYLYGYDYGAGSNFFQAYAVDPLSSFNYQYEYHDNGALAREYYLEDHIMFYVYDSAEFGQIDGHDLAIAFSSLISDGYVQAGTYFHEVIWDEFGNRTSYIERQSYSQARVTAVNAAPGGPTEVPEPAMLGLFGLGIAGVAMGRRRKAA